MKPISEDRITVRMPTSLLQMTQAAAAYEDRKPPDIVRIALKHYFAEQGYFDESFITKLATKERNTP